jgi:hypothetical protein
MTSTPAEGVIAAWVPLLRTALVGCFENEAIDHVAPFMEMIDGPWPVETQGLFSS